MAPEQARGDLAWLDERADVFGLGAILCEILTGKPAYVGQELLQICAKAMTGDLKDALDRLQRCGAEAELVGLARDCLAAEPAARPANAGVVASRMTAYLAGVQERLHTAEVERAAAQARAAAERRARNLTVFLALSLLMLIALGSGAFAWYNNHRAKAAQAVSDDLQEAAIMQGHARWSEARAAVERAEGRLTGIGIGDLRQRVRQVKSDLGLVAELEEIRLQQAEIKDGYFDAGLAATAYADTFRRHDLDWENLDVTEACARLGASSVRPQIVAALDDWVSLLAPEKSKHLREVLNQADPDPWRIQFREARSRTDGQGVAELRRLADQPEVQKLPAITLVLLGNALFSSDPSRAIPMLQSALKRYPNDFWINHQLAFFLYSSKPSRAAEAVGYFRAAVTLRPQSAGVFANLGIALARQGSLAEAESAFHEALARKPDYAEARYNLGTVLYQQGQLEKAAEAFREALRLQPKDAETHNNHGLVLFMQGHADEAIKEYKEALQLRPDNASAQNNLGNALAQRKDLAGALTAFKEAIRFRPDYAEAHYNLGTIYYQQGLWSDAAAGFRQALKVQPNYAEAQYNLGVTLAVQEQYPEAITAFRAAARLRPQDADAQTQLGAALAEQKDLGAATVLLREALQQSPNHPDAHYHLGLVLRRQGQLHGALAELRKAQELGASPPRRYPSPEEALRQTERLVNLEGQLPRILQGKRQPADLSERLELAPLCLYKQQYAASARFYDESFKAQPRLAEDLRAGRRYQAACAASLAGCGQNGDSVSLDEEARTRWRRQALTWLQADLALWRKQLEGRTDRRALVRLKLRPWLDDADLAGLRDPQGLADLPATERAAWQRFWAEVADLLRRTE
jgi:tetratricopeptide (TPR) repeat protein